MRRDRAGAPPFALRPYRKIHLGGGGGELPLNCELRFCFFGVIKTSDMFKMARPMAGADRAADVWNIQPFPDG